jgi:hypothetical protein
MSYIKKETARAIEKEKSMNYTIQHHFPIIFKKEIFIMIIEINILSLILFLRIFEQTGLFEYTFSFIF